MPDAAKLWEELYHARKWGKLTWRQLFALFHKQHGYWPSWSLPYMPLHRVDMALRVRDTPPERLRLPVGKSQT